MPAEYIVESDIRRGKCFDDKKGRTMFNTVSEYFGGVRGFAIAFVDYYIKKISAGGHPN